MHGRGEFRVTVSKDYLVFASAHFITFAGHRCEGLHGHKYRARVTIEGRVNQESWFVHVAVDGRPRYVFPRRDCALLPIPNTTVEMLAEMLIDRLRGELTAAGGTGVTAIEMEVEESFGQSATCRVTIT